MSVILRGRKDLLQVALRHLQPEHFTDTVQRSLFIFCQNYLDQAGGILTRKALDDALRALNQPPGTVLQYEEYYDYLLAQDAHEGDFRWSLAQLRELAAEKMTGEALTQAMTILKQGATIRRTQLQGHKDARSWLMGELAGIDRALHAADAPEGDMRTEVKDITAEFAARRQARSDGTAFLSTAVPELDIALGGGLSRGELGLVGGFTTAGKTSFCVQLAWHACVEQGKNVIIFTSETLRSQIRVKILSRHSRLPKFGLPEGINSKDIKSGTLDQEGVQAFQAVLNDWSTGDYGKCYVAQVPRGATISTIEARAQRLAVSWPADLIVVDYLQLLRADGRFATERESQARVVKDAKEFAATYLDGRGVPLISPWQTSRKARDDAKGGNGYTLSSLSDTHEASATPDVIVTLLEPDDYVGGRHTRLAMQVLKGRDGERGGWINLDADYATSHFSVSSGTSSYDPLAAMEQAVMGD